MYVRTPQEMSNLPPPAEMLKVIEVLAKPEKSWEDAAAEAVNASRKDAQEHPIDLRRESRGQSGRKSNRPLSP